MLMIVMTRTAVIAAEPLVLPGVLNLPTALQTMRSVLFCSFPISHISQNCYAKLILQSSQSP